MFLDRGYTNTTVKTLSDQLNISTGNLTFHFPTKEHMLKVLVRMLCDFQWDMMLASTAGEGSAMDAVCMELVAMAAICEENEIVKDFYICAYTHPMTLEIIRKSDTARSKVVYGQYCPDWTQEDFIEAEILTSGIEFAMLMTTSDAVSLDTRISGVLDLIMTIYNVPDEIRQTAKEHTLKMDYHTLGRQIFTEFLRYIDGIDDESMEKYMDS
jgi:AcrR family transcriptional regulator